MSDVQGADDQSIDDQRDTATGGLVNDTPGLPTQPPSSPGVRPPSVIGGMARRLFQGGPAPKPVQQGRSPYQFPGQSQAPVGGPQSTQNLSRWQGNTASIALPKGSMQPRANFTPFIPGQGTTSHEQWGQIEPYPNLPQPFEAPGILGNLANFFGGTGSPAVAMLALSMGKNGSAFLDGVMKGQEWKAKMHRDQMEDDARQLEITQWKEMHDYQDIVNEHVRASGATSIDAAKNYAINGVTMLDDLANHAMELGDDRFLAVLGNGGVEKAIQFLNDRNNNWQSLSKTNKSIEQQKEQDDRKDWGVPDSQGNAETRSPFDVAAHPQAQAPTQGPQGGPAPSPQGGAQPDQVQPQLPRYQEDGNSVYKGEINPRSLPKGVQEPVTGWAAQQGAKVDQVKAEVAAGRLKPEQIPGALDRIIPGMGADYTDADNGTPLPSGVLGRSPYWQSIKTLIPGYNPVVQQQTQKDFAPGGKDGTRLMAGSRMSGAAITVLKEMKKFKEGEVPLQNVIDQWIATGVTGDPKWSNLFQAVNNYMQDNQALQSPTGRFFESEMQEQRKNLRLTAGLPAIRGLLKVDAENSKNQIKVLRDTYHRGTRNFDKDPPTYDPNDEKILDSLSMIDEQRGFTGIPESNLPDELKGLGLGEGASGEQKGGDGRVHDWRTYFQ